MIEVTASTEPPNSVPDPDGHPGLKISLLFEKNGPSIDSSQPYWVELLQLLIATAYFDHESCVISRRRAAPLPR